MSDDPSVRETTREQRDRKLHDLISAEYKYLTELFIANEEAGEKRVTLFLSLSAGLGAAAVLAPEKLPNSLPPPVSELLIAVNFVWLLFGYMTFLRIVHRNTVTDQYKQQLARLRSWFVDRNDETGLSYLPYNPYGAADTPRGGLCLRRGKGGYAELVGLINSVTAGALSWQTAAYAFELITVLPTSWARVRSPFALVAALLVAGLAWRWQGRLAQELCQEQRKQD